jgi:hypothetical protein
MEPKPQHPGGPADRRCVRLSFLERLQIAVGIATFVVMIALIALFTL